MASILKRRVKRRRAAAAADASPPDNFVRAAAAPKSNGHLARAQQGKCERCGALAAVQLLAGYRDGQPIRRHFCLSCAALAPQLLLPLAPQRHLRLDAALLLAGAIVTVLGVGRDYLLPISVGGFGWHQLLGVSIGGFVVLIGLLMRVDFLAAGGVVVLGIAGSADLLLGHGSAGIGWKQWLLTGVGLLMMAGALRVWQRRRRDNSRAAPDTPKSDLNAEPAHPELAIS